MWARPEPSPCPLPEYRERVKRGVDVNRNWVMLVGALIIWANARAGPATRPTTNPKLAELDRQIAAAILELDSADGGAREKATLKLINIGPRVLKQLKEAMREDSTPEFAARAKGIL